MEETKKETKEATWHDAHRNNLTYGERLADTVANIMGSWQFIIYQTLIVMLWLGLNVIGFVYHFDPFPFIFLNLVLSLMSTYSAPVIMMAQNRQGARDREQATRDYETNLEAKREIEDIQKKLSSIEIEKLDKIISLLENKQEKK